MRAIDRGRYGEKIRKLIDDAFAAGRPRTLPFGEPAADARAALEAVDAPDSLRGGLWLLHDFADEVHGLVQDLETPGSAYWHCIVHRREPDAHNARYWLARVGAHPIFEELGRDAAVLLASSPELSGIAAEGRFHPRRFIELATDDPGGPARDALLAVQRREWELLFDHEWITSGAR
jgi:hypothetical protein